MQIKPFFTSMVGAFACLLAGCAAYGPNPPASAASGPLVQNCGVIQTGTPSRFVCNGKVYTSYQLAKLREDEAKRSAALR